MSDSSHPARPARQFRVTVTDTPSSDTVDVTVAWRTFPCRADDWDGRQHVRIPRRGQVDAVTSEMALREVLLVVSTLPWKHGAVPK